MVVPPQEGSFDSGAVFTPDGNYLYFTHTDPLNPLNVNVYTVPSLGGAPRQIVSDVASSPAFSPDGKRIAYRRVIRAKADDEILIANADGSGEHVIYDQPIKGGTGLYTDPSWSTNNLIAVAGFETRKNEIAAIHVFNTDGKLVKDFPLNSLVFVGLLDTECVRDVLRGRRKVYRVAMADLVPAISFWRTLEGQQ